MDNILNFLAAHQEIIVLGLLVFFGVAEFIFGFYAHSKRTKNDVLVETVSTFFILILAKPSLSVAAFYLTSWLFPSAKGLAAGNPLWLNVIIFLLIDDFLQYWYHRSSHEYKWFWKWHRPHHAAEEMGLLVSYREAIWYYVFIPNIWWAGIFTYLGTAPAVAAGIVLKQIIIVSSHSLITWDSFFYKRKALLPIINVLERIFITPAFHHAHHAKSIVDGIGHPNGNFGNMFSFWDQLFGSAKFTHSFPTEYGLQTDMKDDWTAHMFYPLVVSDKTGSELSRDYTFEKTTTLEPAALHLEAGDYLFCKCGFSKNQPFCDGSHHGTKKQPEKFTIKREGNYKLCNCKKTKKGPFCDNSHLELEG